MGTNPWSSFYPTEAESSFGEDDDDMEGEGPGGPPAQKRNVSAGPDPRLETKSELHCSSRLLSQPLDEKL